MLFWKLPEERSAYLTEACADDVELRRRVERLLKSHAKAGSFLQPPEVDPNATSPPLGVAEVERSEPPAFSSRKSEIANPKSMEGPGSRIGRYRILQQIGIGGFGVVYMAEQEEPVRRHVALKVIKREWTRAKSSRGSRPNARRWR